MKSYKEWIEFMAQPDTVMKVTKYTYLVSCIMTVLMTIGWVLMWFPEDITLVGLIWLFLAWTLFKKYREL